jgi:hypothetical protein
VIKIFVQRKKKKFPVMDSFEQIRPGQLTWWINIPVQWMLAGDTLRPAWCWCAGGAAFSERKIEGNTYLLVSLLWFLFCSMLIDCKSAQQYRSSLDLVENLDKILDI